MAETSKTHIVRGLRKIWLHSKERGEALKRDKYTCQICQRKKSVSKKKFDETKQVRKLEVHHKESILNWDEIIDCIRKNLLCDSEHLQTLCKECHEKVENDVN